MALYSFMSESYPDPELEQLLAGALHQVRASLRPDLAEILLPQTAMLLGVRTELYQSQTLRAGREVAPDSYPIDDRSLIILTLQEDKQVFVVGGKVNPAERFDITRSLGGGVDPREKDRTIYAYDGEQSITEYLQDGSTHTYTGEHGDPEMLLYHIRYRLGECVGLESVGLDPSV